jgi:hypothetical protein
MTELSPAALKVREAAERETDLDFRYASQIAAAIIEALANQVVPTNLLGPPENAAAAQREITRASILDIAAELRGTAIPETRTR